MNIDCCFSLIDIHYILPKFRLYLKLEYTFHGTLNIHFLPIQSEAAKNTKLFGSCP